MQENSQKNSFSFVSKKGYVIGIIGILLLTAAAGYFVVNRQTDEPTPIVCTQEAMLCPDGSYVGRTGPNCEFAPCPGGNPTPTPTPTPVPVQAVFGSPIILAIGEQAKFSDGLIVTLVEVNDSRCPEGVVCKWAGELSPMFRITGGNAGKALKEIRLGTATVTNATENGYTFMLQDATPTTATIMVTKKDEQTPISNTCNVNPDESGKCPVGCVNYGVPLGCVPQEYYDACRSGEGPCPICLAENTLIDTPSGMLAVQNLQKGDSVWTLDNTGERVAGMVLETAKTSVPATHQVVHMVLEDGRELFASPGHPTTDGRTIGELSVGDVLNGSRVASGTPVSYVEGYTYDILPSGETGFYWANGILMASTL